MPSPTNQRGPTSREQEILDAYRAWRDTGTGNVDGVAAALGVTRQRIYQVLRQHDERLSTGRGSVEHPAGIEDAMAQQALGVLLEQLYEARTELAEYRGRFGPL